MRRPKAVVLLLAAALAWLGGAAAAPAEPGHLDFSPAALFGLGRRAPPPSLTFAYHGFSVDASRARRLQPAEKTQRAIDAQIDLVEHVGLKPDVLAEMRATPIRADIAKQGEGARYVAGQGVWLKVRRLDPRRPVLLAGLLRAYHDQRLATQPAGMDVARFRGEALSHHAWPKTALMLQSDTDYFALTGAVYLYGSITREPYSRADLRQTQPQYYHWLAQLFDDGKPRS